MAALIGLWFSLERVSFSPNLALGLTIFIFILVNSLGSSLCRLELLDWAQAIPLDKL